MLQEQEKASDEQTDKTDVSERECHDLCVSVKEAIIANKEGKVHDWCGA